MIHKSMNYFTYFQQRVFSIGHTDGYECLDDMFHCQVTEHTNIRICPKDDAALLFIPPEQQVYQKGPFTLILVS